MLTLSGSRRSKALAVVVCLGMAFAPLRAAADDVDIFIGSSGGVSSNPNVLIILDNTSNWNRQSQHWPGGITQGQAEVAGIQTVINSLGGGPSVAANVNVGLMLFTDNSSGRAGGYVRYAVKPMTVANKLALSNILTGIFNNLGANQTSSTANYGSPLFDAFKYFGGYTSPSHVADGVAGTPADATHFGPAVYDTQQTYHGLADLSGYTGSALTTFSSPIATADSCARNFIIFIGNGFPNADDYSLLSGVQGDITEIAVPNFVTTNQTVTYDGGYGTCSFGTSGTLNGGYGACSRSNNASTVGNTCPAGTTVVANTGRSKTPNTCPSPNTNKQWGVDCTYVSNPSTVGNTCIAGDTVAANTLRPKTPNTCSSPQQQWGVDCSYTRINVSTTDPVTGALLGYSAPGNKARSADEWARYLYQTDASGVTGQQNVTTYTIDAFNAQQDANQTALLMSMARVGGGKYYPASNQGQIATDLQNIFGEIQGVNSTFASASLPISASNRAVRDNQIYVGVFRPDPDLKPRWFGNLKQYQLVLDASSGVALADAAGTLAVNPLTGFITSCATSFWTTDSLTYWKTVPINPPPEGTCTTAGFSIWSDAPDGPMVEKGAVAEVIRKGNNPPTTNLTPTWAVNRTMKTFQSGGLTGFTTASSGLAQTLVDFTLGKDVNDENGNGNVTETRPSVHGDVIHSRPLAIDYGDPTGVVVYYGSNDGAFRAVDGSSGHERWAFVANEFFSARTTSGGASPLQRLKDNTLLVSYGTSPLAGSQLRDYLFDGSIGSYQNADLSKVWIYPTMRRGGRMVYALDVSNPGSPVFKWKIGCPNLDNDTGCTAGMTGIGQTWSMPNVAFIKGYSTTAPLVAVGGGYDACEDANTSAPSCATPKGNHVYIFDADTGSVLRTFDTERSVIADVAYTDVDFDGYPDFAYVADTGGNMYRIDFVDSNKVPLASSAWSIHVVAYTNGSGRKFEFAPAMLPNKGKVYLALGSGDREHPLQAQYPFTTPVTNRFYVYLDDLSISPASKTQAVNLDDLSSFQDFTVNQTCGTSNILPNSTQKGWRMNLNQHGVGEQTVTSAIMAGGVVTFSTNRPIPAVAGTCTTLLGEARGYMVNMFNGSGAIGVTGSCGGDQSATFTGGGLPPSPVLAKVVVDGQTETVLLGAIQKNGGPSCAICAQTVLPPLNYKRKMMYWFTSGTDSK
jgi:type IV pilus assembly protein PilY1